MLGAGDAFAAWFIERAQAVHGVDLSIRPTGAPSELVVDSDRAIVTT